MAIYSPIIFLDAGHSAKNGDPGAVSGKFVEYEINALVVKSAAQYLSERFVCRPVVDYNNTIEFNCARAKELGAKAFVSVHHNAGGGDGSEIFFHPKDKKAKLLAELIAIEFRKIGQNSRGVKSSTYFGVLKNNQNKIPAILGEFAFVDNAKDRQIIDNSEKIKQEGYAYARALATFLKLQRKVA